MGYGSMETKAKRIQESLEQGECFYVGKEYNAIMAALDGLKAEVQKHWDSYQVYESEISLMRQHQTKK